MVIHFLYLLTFLGLCLVSEKLKTENGLIVQHTEEDAIQQKAGFKLLRSHSRIHIAYKYYAWKP